MKAEPRVAFFPDSFVEVNGVAHTSRQLVAYARSHQSPMLCVYGTGLSATNVDGSVTQLALRRSRCGFALDADLRNDLLLWRHAPRVLQAVREFNADLIHITGPNDTGQLGAYVAWRLGLPLVCSWHTNVHQYAGRRVDKLLSGWLPQRSCSGLSHWAETLTLRAALRFYQLGRVQLAPCESLRALLSEATRKPTYLMQRGVDATLYTPQHRFRHDNIFQIGYVGRLTPEKNLRVLAEVEQRLLAAGHRHFRFVITGAGSELAWLRDHLQHVQFNGVLRGTALARAYANLDLFVFPSTTDTFGNVVLEAQASGIPALVSAHGGPSSIIKNGETGLIADGAAAIAAALAQLMTDRARLAQMGSAARAHAQGFTWDAIFARVYEAYEHCLQLDQARAAESRNQPRLDVSAETATR
jgi:phosphatidylinositol alpha 1,6-mannosyltransferase